MTTIVRFDPLRELAALQNEMSRALGGIFGDPSLARSSSQGWVPPLDVWEAADEVIYALDVPGVPEYKISIELEDGALTVSGERVRETKPSDGTFYRYERRHGAFQRTISLPGGVAESDVSASYSNGVLELHVRKPELPKPHRIPISQSDQSAVEGHAHRKS
jgi:HSP20 family protein